MGYADLSATLTSLLSLDDPPVALSFVDGAPDDVGSLGRPVTSACALWREAETGVFYASAAEHFNCPVGAMVMGFSMPDELQKELGGLVQSMCDAKYLTMEEAERIPSVSHSGQGIVYGPLADLPVEPDLVVLWLTPAQAMIFNESAGTANWAGGLGEVSGRPGCAALALAHSQNQARMSLGCMGMRTFTGISDDRVLAALPGESLPAFIEALQTTHDANEQMRQFYEGRKASLADSG
jgi:uncharacterized protein (DUF169 family)